MSAPGQGFPPYGILGITPMPVPPVMLSQTPMQIPVYPQGVLPQPFVTQNLPQLPPTEPHQNDNSEDDDSSVEYEMVGTKKVKKDEVGLELDKNYNLSDVLTTAILHSQYFKSL